jgi:hypothetical protein
MVTDGCFFGKGMSRVAPPPELKKLEAIFRHKVFGMLVAKGKISPPAACRKSWARLIQKIYEIDPLTCPKCRGSMRIISTIEDQEVIKSILNHLGLWSTGSRPRPKAHAPPVREYVADGFCSAPDNVSYGDSDYSWDAYI